MLIFLALLGCTDPGGKGAPDAAVPGLVPLPAVVEDGEGTYVLDAATTIAAEGDAAPVAALLAEALRAGTGLPFPVEPGSAGGIVLLIDPSVEGGDEGYVLDVAADGVTLAAAAPAGLFYGAQTLRQLLAPASFGPAANGDADWSVPVAHIEDAPRFVWRGFMLDVARHFFTVDEVKRQIDLMSAHKLNRLHLHLTDDQGWRIEIAAWPRLTEIGGATEVGGGEGGYYTQADYAEIVAYAEARYVTVVPEIDFPGHANAALSAYAELNESGEPADVYTGAGVISTPLWLEGPATYGFVADVWREVAAITPGPWVHVGGDEAVGVDDDAYAAFLLFLQETVGAEGKILLGWDEIGGVPLDPPFYAQHWFSASQARTAAEDGALLIASPAAHAYLDMVHDSRAAYGQTWAGPVNVEATYDWNPTPFGVDDAAVAGIEGALWTEYVEDEGQIDYMAWPRLAALAEHAWAPAEAKDWWAFRDRLGWHGARLEAAGVGYYRSPEIAWTRLASTDAR